MCKGPGVRGVVIHLGHLEKASVAQAGERRGERRAGATLSPTAGVFSVCLFACF